MAEVCYNIFMSFKQKLEHRQKPVFSQSLRQSVKILELPLLELKNTVEAELAENPVIEEIPQPPSSPEPTKEIREPEEDYPSSYDKELPSGELVNYEKPIFGKRESLNDTLLKQLRINTKDEQQLKIGTALIDLIDANGYLKADFAVLATELDCSENEILRILQLIQTFDPSGVGARDLKECLLIQLKKRQEKDDLLFKLIENHLEELAAGKDINKLCKKLKCSPEEFSRCIEKIHGLEPKPGRAFADDVIAYIIPDVTIEEKDGELVISTKDDSIPAIRINPVYRSMLKSKTVNEETKEFIRNRYIQAQNLIRAIKSRKDTLLKVVSHIAETQREAIREGADKLKPLTLNEIAEKVEMHESTISRVVRDKYVQTPSGLWPLKDFFSGSLRTTEGNDISSQSIKLKIQELIESEDKTNPLRDQKIVEMINATEKISLARRTVAKYRDMLKIPPVSQRRKSM